MKTALLLTFSFVLLLAFANQPAEASDAVPVAGTCYAETYCPSSGATVYCQTWGDGCTWYVQPGNYVRCTGANAAGYWVDVTVPCP